MFLFQTILFNRFFLVKSNNADNVEIAKVLLRFKIIKKLIKILTEIIKVLKTMTERTKWDHIMPTSINLPSLFWLNQRSTCDWNAMWLIVNNRWFLFFFRAKEFGVHPWTTRQNTTKPLRSQGMSYSFFQSK